MKMVIIGTNDKMKSWKFQIMCRKIWGMIPGPWQQKKEHFNKYKGWPVHMVKALIDFSGYLKAVDTIGNYSK